MIIPLPSNRPPARFYRGGARIAVFRGEQAVSANEPEDWVASTTTLAGDDGLGLTTLPDGRLLRDAILADPERWLGRAHVERWGADSQLLVKLLDPGQRLPVHAHPSDRWAAAHVGRAHGKAEAWYILRAGTVWVGLRDAVDPVALRRLVDTQDTATLLALLHEVVVEPGDVVWVPPGELHAIGEGVMLLELQQPEDLSILLEWHGFDLDGTRDGHLGVGFDIALTAINLDARADIGDLVRTPAPSGSQFPSSANGFFRLERLDVEGSATMSAGFAILVVTTGPVTATPTRNGEPVELAAGSTSVVAASAGDIGFQGTGTVLVCRPPAA